MRSNSVATPSEKRYFQTYLRRLSYRSGKHPGAFHLRDIVEFPHVLLKRCSHSRGRSQTTMEGGFGEVRRAKGTKLEETVVVAIKTLKVSQRLLFVVSSSVFENILV